MLSPRSTHYYRLQTTDSPLQNNQSKSLPDNWSVHCWGHRNSLEVGLVPGTDIFRDYLINRSIMLPGGGREGRGSHLLQYCGGSSRPPTLSRSKLRQKLRISDRGLPGQARPGQAGAELCKSNPTIRQPSPPLLSSLPPPPTQTRSC